MGGCKGNGAGGGWGVQIKSQPGEQGALEIAEAALGLAGNRAKDTSQMLPLHPTDGFKSGTQGHEELAIY